MAVTKSCITIIKFDTLISNKVLYNYHKIRYANFTIFWIWDGEGYYYFPIIKGARHSIDFVSTNQSTTTKGSVTHLIH